MGHDQRRTLSRIYHPKRNSRQGPALRVSYFHTHGIHGVCRIFFTVTDTVKYRELATVNRIPHDPTTTLEYLEESTPPGGPEDTTEAARLKGTTWYLLSPQAWAEEIAHVEVYL